MTALPSIPAVQKVRFDIQNVSFVAEQDNSSCKACVVGTVKQSLVPHKFCVTLLPDRKQGWIARQFEWIHTAPPSFANNKDLKQYLMKRTLNVVKTINMWPGEQTAEGAKLVLNEIIPPADAEGKVVNSYRADLLKLPSPTWDNLWGLIKNNVVADPYFKVHGFEKAQATKVLDDLEHLFPASWVKRVYRDHTGDKEPSMAAAFPPEASPEWFPAYHLARTAIGAICIDPGWNYLVEIGLSLDELSNFDGVARLKRQLCKSPGTQHHVCLAADLHKRGYLTGLEPVIGSGSATHDLLTCVDGHEYEIEVKEFASNNPERRLVKEIEKKVEQLPHKLSRPIIFHTVLSENQSGRFDKDKETQFLSALNEVSANLSPKISAVLVGRCVIDSSGGRVKRKMIKMVLNPAALIPCNPDHLELMFAQNYKAMIYPCFGIGSLFYFGLK